MSVLGALLSLCALVPQAENRPALEPAELREASFVRMQELERRERFRAAWLVADHEARERARRRLAAARRGNAPAAAGPVLSVLEEARALLEGREPSDLLARAADALALRAVPGVLAALDESSAGTSLHVELRCAWRGAALALVDAEGLELALVWLGPRGERLEALRRPCSPAELERGLTLELGAPALPAGAWRLAPELLLGERRARGAAIDLPALEELEARLTEVRRAREEARAPGALPGPMARQAAAFLAWVDEGLRPASGLSPESLWQQMSRWPLPPERSEPWPLHAEESSAAAAWELAPQAAGIAAIVLVGSPSEPPESWLSGTRGAAWRRAAELAGWTVLALEAPLLPARLAALAERLEKERGLARLVLVASGASATHALLTELPGVDRLALLTTLAGRPQAPAAWRRPVLLVQAEAQDDGREFLRGRAAGRLESVLWQRRSDPLLAVELELPWLVLGWLSEEPPARPAGERAPR